MHNYALKDEADVSLWAGDAPVASITLIKLKDDVPFQNDFKLDETRKFIQYNFDMLPSIKN